MIKKLLRTILSVKESKIPTEDDNNTDLQKKLLKFLRKVKLL